MHSDSHKAQRNSFAHHRAQHLFARHEAQAGDTVEWSATVHEGTEPEPRKTSRRKQIIAGLIGFVPAGTNAAVFNA